MRAWSVLGGGGEEERYDGINYIIRVHARLRMCEFVCVYFFVSVCVCVCELMCVMCVCVSLRVFVCEFACVFMSVCSFVLLFVCFLIVFMCLLVNALLVMQLRDISLQTSLFIVEELSSSHVTLIHIHVKFIVVILYSVLHALVPLSLPVIFFI